VGTAGSTDPPAERWKGRPRLFAEAAFTVSHPWAILFLVNAALKLEQQRALLSQMRKLSRSDGKVNGRTVEPIQRAGGLRA
jgi:hypothetical protein